jgi:hypothetical protein
MIRACKPQFCSAIFVLSDKAATAAVNAPINTPVIHPQNEDYKLYNAEIFSEEE